MKRSSLIWALSLLGCAAIAAAAPNAVRYELEATLDVARNVVRGHERLTLTNHSGQALPELYFHLAPNAFRRGADTAYQRDLARLGTSLDRVFASPADDAFLAVERVALAGQTLSFTLEDSLMRVALPVPLAPEGTITLEIDFLNDLVEAGPGHRFAGALAVRSGSRREVVTGAKWYPQLAVFDAAGWHAEPYRLLGEFYADFGDYDLRLTVPAGWVVGATGERLEERVNADGTRTLRYEAENVHDLAWVASPRYRVRELRVGDKLVRALWLDRPELAELAADALRYFSETFGPYAYRTLTVAQVEVGGGMEYPGLVMIAQGSVEEVSHEVAHQWWYAAVGNDEFHETWLDEGPTTFSSELYRIEARGEPDALRRMLAFREPGVPILTPAPAFPSVEAFVQAIYTKGSAIFWMLDEVLGRRLLLAALRAYYARFRFRNATSADLIATFSQVAGQDLAWFFDPWLRTTATFDAALEEVRFTSDGKLGFEVVQEGEIRMPIRIRIEDDAGAVRELRWDGRQARTRFEVAGPAGVRRLILDPRRKLLDVDRGDNVWSAAPPASDAALGLLVLVALAGLTRRCRGA